MAGFALGEVEGTDAVKYLRGAFSQGTFTFLGGHDPGDHPRTSV